MVSQNHLRLLVLSLLFVSSFLLLSSCGTDIDPGRPPADLSSWTLRQGSVGEIHNEILREYRSLPPRDDVVRRAREAILRRAMADEAATPGLQRQVERILDGPAFGLIQRRLDSVRRLVREGHPDPRALTRVLEGWGVAPAEAAQLGRVVAHILLSRQLPPAPAKIGGSEATAVFYDVLESSREFWTEEAALSKLTVESEVIAFDALGALGGLSLGVIGSIVGSAVYSIIWQEAGVPSDDSSVGCAGCH